MGKTKRVKPETTMKLNDLSAVDATLCAIAAIRQELKTIETDLDAGITALRENARQEAEPLKKKMESLEAAIRTFSDYNKPELFKDKKSLELVFGTFGYRSSSRIAVRKDTLELLKKLGFEEAVRVTETVNKEELAKWGDEKLALVSAEWVEEDKFWYEIKEEALTDTVKVA